jgi:hypothetical protein
MKTHSLDAWSACTYPGAELMQAIIARTILTVQDTWDAKKFVSAIKGEAVNGYASVPVPIDGARRRSLKEGNKDDVLKWFPEMVLHKFLFDSEPMALLLIPPHDATSAKDVTKARMWACLDALEAKIEASVAWPGLWWKNAEASARKGGSRSPATIRSRCVIGKLPRGVKQVLLVDDVVTSGGHLLGVAAALRDAGLEPVAGICVGRTVNVQDESPFSWRKRELSDRF